MIFYWQTGLILISLIVFWSCEKNVTISKSSSLYVPKIHITKISANEKIPSTVRKLLQNENPAPSTIIKFPLAYYLIQEEDINRLSTLRLEDNINDQLFMTISGVRHYKIFVHPDMDKAYTHLKHAYRFIGPDESEFFASPISTQKTLVVWSKSNPTKKPFIVKIGLDKKLLSSNGSRLPAEVKKMTPGLVNIVIKNPSKGVQEGQQITEVPSELSR